MPTGFRSVELFTAFGAILGATEAGFGSTPFGLLFNLALVLKTSGDFVLVVVVEQLITKSGLFEVVTGFDFGGVTLFEVIFDGFLEGDGLLVLKLTGVTCLPTGFGAFVAVGLETFIPDASGVETFVADASGLETFVADASGLETFVTDASGLETFIADASALETFVADASRLGTFVADEFGFESFVANEFGFVADEFGLGTFIVDEFGFDSFVPGAFGIDTFAAEFGSVLSCELVVGVLMVGSNVFSRVTVFVIGADLKVDANGPALRCRVEAKGL